MEDRLDRLSRLVHLDRGALVALARSEGLDAEEALECVQDGLCTFLGREDEPDDDLARASLRTIVRNAARNFRRRHFRALPHFSWDEDLAVAELDNADELLANAEDVVRLRSCVAELCEVQRAVVTLRLLEERSGEDVASVLGLTRGHVDVLVHRAKSSLRVCMRAH